VVLLDIAVGRPPELKGSMLSHKGCILDLGLTLSFGPRRLVASG
jgi:hypothetical protein